ncbi:MAG: beta-lactamase family protein [Acidobacteriota bacterium]|nr:beta-lactamase family protein [Acidobacteriota bacterium]
MNRHIYKMRLALLALLTASLVPFSVGQVRSDNPGEAALTDRVDALFAQWAKPDLPGCALGVIKDGRMIYKRGYGMANLDYDIPISSSSVFYIASTSKQFTAASIALLAKQGKIWLDDPIRRYMPELSELYNPVTIRHLIHHTSGIRDYLTLMSIAAIRTENIYTDEDVIELLSRQKALNFKPGDQHFYSNSGYLLLSMIVKRVTGKSLRQFADENIFKPLGMKNTHFHDDRTMIVKNRAISYALKKDGSFSVVKLTSIWLVTAAC